MANNTNDLLKHMGYKSPTGQKGGPGSTRWGDHTPIHEDYSGNPTITKKIAESNITAPKSVIKAAEPTQTIPKAKLPDGPGLNVKNLAQKVLFTHELQGQISDGMWENVPGDHWKDWSGIKPENVTVAAENGHETGRHGFSPKKDNYNLTNPQLIDVVGDRMMRTVRLAKHYGANAPLDNLESGYKFPEGYNKEEVEKVANDDKLYNKKDLMNDLKDLKKHFKNSI